jgi:hypothetical protein
VAADIPSPNNSAGLASPLRQQIDRIHERNFSINPMIYSSAQTHYKAAGEQQKNIIIYFHIRHNKDKSKNKKLSINKKAYVA